MAKAAAATKKPLTLCEETGGVLDHNSTALTAATNRPLSSARVVTRQPTWLAVVRL